MGKYASLFLCHVQQEKQRGTFFSIFYLSINAGSLLSTIITPILRGTADHGARFAQMALELNAQSERVCVCAVLSRAGVRYIHQAEVLLAGLRRPRWSHGGVSE